MMAVRAAMIAHVALWSLSPAFAAPDPDSLPRRSPEEALEALLPEARRLTAWLEPGIEAFRIRANRCAPLPEGDRDDLFYIWIGVRAAAPDSAMKGLIKLRQEWQAAGLHETRFRRLENCGIILGAMDPETGNSYSFDSGLPAGPDTYVIGLLATPCLLNPEGPVSFGYMEAPDAQR